MEVNVEDRSPNIPLSRPPPIEPVAIDVDASPRSSHGVDRENQHKTQTKDFYVEIPYMSISEKLLYKPVQRWEADAVSDSERMVEIIGENREGTELFYYAQSVDGVARKYPARTVTSKYSDFLQEYQHKKENNLLGAFDPTAHYVHPNHRVRLTLTLPKRQQVHQSNRAPSRHADSEDGDDSTDDSDSYSGEDSGDVPVRRSRRKVVVESRGRDLPFSPRKTRSRVKTLNRASESDSAEDGDEYGPRKRPIRRRDGSTPNSEDSQRRFLHPAKKARKPTEAPRLEYGFVREMETESHVDPLNAHRSICERCHEPPTTTLLRQRKGKGKRRSRNKQTDDELSDEEGQIQRLGGWVRCMQCCVAAHWGCLAATQRDEILRAARARTTSEQGDGQTQNRKDLSVSEMTDFICGNCAKGGFCMICSETVQSKEPNVGIQPIDANDATATSGAIEAIDMPDAPPTSKLELLFRCLTCKRVAHYSHLPNPSKGDLSPTDKAAHYQQDNEWECQDCHSYTYALDKIIAWRPYPATASEPPQDQPRNPKISLPREYLVKWIDRSYRRAEWVPHLWLAATNTAKLKNFLTVGTRVKLLDIPLPASSESVPSHQQDDVQHVSHAAGYQRFDPLAASPDAELRIPLAWKTPDRVLDVLLWYPKKTVQTSDRKRPVKRKGVAPESHDSEDAALNSDMEEEYRAAFEDGETPSEAVTETVGEYEARKGRKLGQEDIDRVVFAFMKWDDLTYDEATWDSPPKHEEPTYTAFRTAFGRFVSARALSLPARKKNGDRWDHRVIDGYSSHRLLDGEQPDLGQDKSLTLMPFQIDGFNWLCDNWWNHQHCILADEMGLGKTVQIATFLGSIVTKWKAAPVLVVVPNSTITNWVRELERWAPQIRVVAFYGEARARKIIKDYELYHPVSTDLKFHVLVTTYETLTGPNDFSIFRNVPRWEALVVDEAQRLKGNSSLLFKKLNDLNTIHRIILTGTPLNNNIRELFNLMNFLDPNEWSDLEQLEKDHEELTEELVKDLHNRLRPYFLRRIKSEVLTLPPKNEVIVPVSMSPLQKNIYKSILSQNVQLLQSLVKQASSSKVTSAASKTNLNNILMQLRKCLQHPYLISDDIEPRGLSHAEAHSKLIDASGKLCLLKMLLPRLKARGRRVLLFSQFAIALDILEDFVRGEEYKYLRLDGNTKQADRQKGMDEFNREYSDIFLYMLTTRAGGVGINLWSADTVIIFDPDFNPHQDLQAIARAHRYGQTKTCLVFKLMVKESAEERIMQTGKKKLALDHLIVQKMDDEDSGVQDIQSVLTYGAKALFDDEANDSKDINYTENDVEKLIDKTEQEGEYTNQPKEGGLSFAFAKVWSAARDTLEDIPEDSSKEQAQDDAWAQTLRRLSAQHEEAVTEVTGRGARRRAAAGAYREMDELDAPQKPHNKGRKSKPITGDDDDFVDETWAINSQLSDGDGDNLDFSMPLADDDLLGNHDQGPQPRRIPPIDRIKPSKNTFSLPQQVPPRDVQGSAQRGAALCGLCHTVHGDRQCYMTEDSENLAQYRNMLLTHVDDESWEERYTAIQVIDETLHKRGKMHLIQGQPLMLVDNRVPRAAPSSRVPNKPTISHLDSTRTDVMPPTNRLSPSVQAKEMSRKKPKPNPSCPVCGQIFHSISDCPVIGDPGRVAQEITRLEKNGKNQATVDALRKHLWKMKRQERSTSGEGVTLNDGPGMSFNA